MSSLHEALAPITINYAPAISSVRPYDWLAQFSLSRAGDEVANRAQPSARSPFMVDFLSTKNADFPQTIGTTSPKENQSQPIVSQSRRKNKKKMAHLQWNFLKQ
jgi:hypothetical protein